MSLTFAWPALLWTLLLPPLVAAFYLHLLHRRSRHPVAFSTFSLLQSASTGSGARRHLPALFFLIGLIVLLLAVARPIAPLPVPADRAAIVLAMDVSGSMRSQDIHPTRIDAAKAAAKDFLKTLPPRVRVGLVVFAGYTSVLSPPTTDHEHLKFLIDGLGLARRTAIGEGLLEAVAALPGRARPAPDGSLPPLISPLPPGIVILLSDGRSNTGIDPLVAAEIARRQQVTVYTIGVGQRVTPDNAWTIGGPMDEEALQSIATLTGGTYFHASSASALHGIYRRLARTVGWERRPTEVSAVAAGLAALLVLASLATSRLRVPLAT